jgi:hypothetical protein
MVVVVVVIVIVVLLLVVGFQYWQPWERSCRAALGLLSMLDLDDRCRVLVTPRVDQDRVAMQTYLFD